MAIRGSTRMGGAIPLVPCSTGEGNPVYRGGVHAGGPRMRPALVVALVAALLPVPPASASPGEGGDKAPATPDAEAEWITLRNDMETIEYRVPPGYVPKEITNPSIVLYGSWPEGPFKGVIVTGYSYAWKGGTLEKFMEFVVKDVAGQEVEF